MTATSKTETYLQYRAAKGVNHTWLSKMKVSALAFKRNVDLRQTEALVMGRLNHLCTLEHVAFLQTALVWQGGFTRPKSGEPKPTKSKSSADYQEFKKAQEELGHVVVSQSKIDLCERIASRVQKHPFAKQLLDGAENELSIYWTHPLGVQCKSRLDAVSSRAVVDLKFVEDVTPDHVNRAIPHWGYDSQAAFYQDSVRALTGEKRPYYLVCAEKSEPLDVVVYELDDAILGLGRQKYTRWLERYVECQMHERWPGISATPIKAELANWVYEEDITRNISFAGMEIESA